MDGGAAVFNSQIEWDGATFYITLYIKMGPVTSVLSNSFNNLSVGEFRAESAPSRAARDGRCGLIPAF
jgi:hypothetical protein